MFPMVRATRYLRYLIASLLVLLLAACTQAPPKFKGLDLSQVDWGGDFELTAHTGKRVKASEFRGKVLILFFGYTHCPDICVPTLAKLAAVVKRLGADAERVQVVFVTVDPQHDTPAQLAPFVANFHPSFIGLTGTAQEIAAVASDYKIAYQKAATGHGLKGAPQHELIEHFGGVLIKDAQGKLRLLYALEHTDADIEHDVRLLLKAKS